MEPRSLAVRNHSPDGFAWGYFGSGPAQLALAILLDRTGDADRVARHYQAFKPRHGGPLALDGFRSAVGGVGVFGVRRRRLSRGAGMSRDVLYALVLFLTGGLGYALGRAHAHEAFNRVLNETLAAIRKHLRAEGGEAREMRRSAALLARMAVGFADTAETDPAARELKAINESLQHAKSAETTAKIRFEQLYNGEKKAREAAEEELDRLAGINRGLSRRMAAAFATCRNGCLETSGRASIDAAAAGAEDPARGGEP